MNIYIDADACPVKGEAAKVAGRHALQIILVTNSWMRLPEEWKAKLIVVDNKFDAADNWIADQVLDGDIVVTADIPLADRVIKARGHVIEPNGRILSQDNIGNILATRNLMQELRGAGEVSGGPAPFQKEDRSRFLQELEQLIQSIKRNK